MATHDVVVVGGGHNGLVAGVVLAREGLDVAVVEANPEAGGCVWSETLDSGHRLERGAVDHSQVVPTAEELGLASFGLQYQRRPVAAAAAFGDGSSLLFPAHSSHLDATVGRTGDVEGYRRLSRLGKALFDLIDLFSSPPTLTSLAAALHALPQGDEIMRMITASADSVLAEHLRNRKVISALAMYAAHSQVPSFMPGTGSFAVLLPASLDDPPARPVGGSSALIAALQAALEAAGGTLLTEARVVAIHDLGTARSLRLADGRELQARWVVSTLDLPRTTELVQEPPTEMTRAARRLHDGALNVGELKLDLALTERPEMGPLEQAPEALWLLQGDVDSLRRRYGEVLSGRLPEETALMWAAPSEHDATAAPPGGAVMWLSAFVPLHPHGQPWSAELEEQAADALLDGFAGVVGIDLRPYIADRRVTGPTGWARRLGSKTGNPNHLDLTLDQMLGWRPPGMADHRTPLGWLYLSGAGTHPGGGLSGIAGKNAANRLLADLGGKRQQKRGGRIAALRAAVEGFRVMGR